jgi:hypothetical protein
MRTTFRRECLPKAFTYSLKAYHSKKVQKLSTSGHWVKILEGFLSSKQCFTTVFTYYCCYNQYFSKMMASKLRRSRRFLSQITLRSDNYLRQLSDKSNPKFRASVRYNRKQQVFTIFRSKTY